MPEFLQGLLGVFDTLGRADAYIGTYDPSLIATSVLIAVLAAFVALSTAARIGAATSRWARWAWSSAGAVSMGGGIWSMHFIGMLAFSLPCGVSYDLFGTVLSMIPGILASGVALSVISRNTEPDLPRLIVGAVLMGAGIGTMHYSGMAAMRPDALLRYDPGLVALSVAVAVVLAFASLGIRFRLNRSVVPAPLASIAAATVMGCAVAGMHYTAMEAAVFYPLTGLPTYMREMPPATMALFIAVVTVLIATMTLVATFAGRQNELVGILKAEIARGKALEQAAEGGRARLQAIFDAVVDAIVTIDKRGRITQWSSGAQRIFGYAPDEIVGFDLTILMPQPHKARHNGYIGSFLRTRDAKIIGTGRELTAIRKDGTEFPIELAVSEVRDGEDVFFTGILRDITERKRVEADLVRAREQAEAANVAKSQFVATMSHEIRTPLNGVLGMANLLVATPMNERQSRLVETLQRSGQALLSIINDILDFSKIEAGRLELFEIEFDPREVIADVTDLLCERCTSKGLEFVYFVAEDVPSHVIGDPVRLRQVLINLVGNAIKFTERGEILVELTVADSGPDRVVLTASVQDTGIGIPSDKLAIVFEPFQQVDASMSRARGGSGLGLAISRQLVETMGGTIDAQSEPGRGSRFHFTVSCRPGSAAGKRADRAIERPLRALVLDTNAVSARVLSHYLTRWGVSAHQASDAIEAEAAWDRATSMGRGFDVVIVDVKGLGMTGVELARKIREDRRGKPAELILLIGMETALEEERIEELGAIAILTKPPRPSELFDCLASVAAGGRQRGIAPFFMRRSADAQRLKLDARILVVEDNAVNQEVATGILDNMGCKVETAPNGAAAVRLYAQGKFDLVLMDCEMPEMDGFEATRRIREIERLVGTPAGAESRQRRIPIIALTAHALGEVRDRCLAAGMDDYLTKPFSDRQMGEALRRWLARRMPCASDAPAQPPASPAAQESAIDTAVIDNIRKLGRKGEPSVLEKVVAQFAATAPALAATIRTAAEGGDADGLWRAAHSLKSSAAALGARHLSQRCAGIEACARESGVEPVLPLVEGLDDEVAAAVKRLQQLSDATHELAQSAG